MRFIYSIRKSFQGAYVINGVIGSRQYFYLPKRECIKRYNCEAKEDSMLYNHNKNIKLKESL